jgi:DHA2 family multidrug resistance protein-like MFS transporter
MQVTALIAAGILVVTGIFAWRTIPRRFEVSEDTGMLEVIEQ